MVGWEVWCGVGWKEEEVIGRRVQECIWLSAKRADKTEQKPTRTRNSGNGEHPEIRKISNNKNKMHTTRISQRSREM